MSRGLILISQKLGKCLIWLLGAVTGLFIITIALLTAVYNKQADIEDYERNLLSVETKLYEVETKLDQYIQQYNHNIAYYRGQYEVSKAERYQLRGELIELEVDIRSQLATVKEKLDHE